MKDENSKRELLAKQLLAQYESNPEILIEKLLADIAHLKNDLNHLHYIIQPVPKANEKTKILELAIKNASRQMHTAFHLCHVPNAILTTVSFPDGTYRLTFRKEKAKPIISIRKTNTAI
jgi:excinuclease UvrABC nuclease subunit